jgi:hypothetical protein
MSELEHHHHEHDHNQHHGHAHASVWRPHHDWRLWVAVALMLAGMVAYVCSMDESLRIGGKAVPQATADVSGK